MKKIHILVSGIVQGVAFRYFAVRKANELGITGWVKNLFNGKVEIIAEGENWQLKDFVKDIKIGPPSATVIGIEVKEEEFKNEFDSFEVRF